jgi:hypothetical protein
MSNILAVQEINSVKQLLENDIKLFVGNAIGMRFDDLREIPVLEKLGDNFERDYLKLKAFIFNSEDLFFH